MTDRDSAGNPDGIGERLSWSRWPTAGSCMLALREACARIAETPVAGEQDDITMEAKRRVAAAIRQLDITTFWY